MADDRAKISERMRADWNRRAREDANYYVAFGARDQDEAAFLASATDEVRTFEAELQRFPTREGLKALEIGCGPGRLMKLLNRHFAEIHGVDVSDEMIRLARERLRDLPHAHPHLTSGAGLAQFADESFDYVFSYAVFQHIPNREVVLEYMRETRRVLKPGGIFHGQFNGRAHLVSPDTWSGVFFTGDEIARFTRENDFQLLNLDGPGTQYMWTTWRKKPVPPAAPAPGPPVIRRVTNAYSGEPLIPNRGRQAALAIWTKYLPPECELNNLDVLVEGVSAPPFYIGPASADGLQQVNTWLPQPIRTGLLPVELLLEGRRLCDPAIARLFLAGPNIPRIVAVTDGCSIAVKSVSLSGALKIHVEEVVSPSKLSATVDGQPVEWIDITCIDPRPPRHEIDIRLPRELPAGWHRVVVHVGGCELHTDIETKTPSRAVCP